MNRLESLLLILTGIGSAVGSTCVLMIYAMSYGRGFQIEVITNPYGDFWLVTGLMMALLVIGFVGVWVGSESRGPDA